MTPTEFKDRKRNELIQECYANFKGVLVHYARQWTNDPEEMVHDCLLRVMEYKIEIESVAHVRALMFKRIKWQSWAEFKKKHPIFELKETDKITSPILSASFDLYPLREKAREHIHYKLSPRLREVNRLNLLGYKNVEIKEMMGYDNKSAVATAKIEIIEKTRLFQNSAITPMERSLRNRDGITDEIMKLTDEGFSNMEISKKVGLSLEAVKGRKKVRRKLLNRTN